MLSSGIILSLLSVSQVSAEEMVDPPAQIATIKEAVTKSDVALENLVLNFSEEKFTFSERVNEIVKSIYFSYNDEELYLKNSEESLLIKEMVDSKQVSYKYDVEESNLLIKMIVLDQTIQLKVPINYFDQVTKQNPDKEELANEDETKEPLKEDLVETPNLETPIPDDSTVTIPNEELELEVPTEKEESGKEEGALEEYVPVEKPESTTPKLEESPIDMITEKKETKEPVVHDSALIQPKMSMRAMKITPIPTSGVHVVKSGDSLSRIGTTYGISMSDLIKWNNIENANLIRVGQKIILNPEKVTDTRIFKTKQEFLNYFTPIMSRIAKEKGLYASVMIAQAMHESNYGNSGLSSAPYYNLFGIKGSYKGKSVSMLTWEDNGEIIKLNANFRDYESYEESIYDYANLLRSGTTENKTRYSRTWLENAANYEKATYGLILDKSTIPVKGGYATDRNYGDRILSTIKEYQLYRYDVAYSNILNGWHVVNGNERFYKNDNFFTGLKKVGQTTYLFNGNGDKEYGWHKLNGRDYYFDPKNGGMLTGKRKIGQTTYLLSSAGNKEYGWHKLNGKEYYFSPGNGGMLTGKRKIENTTYLFNENGAKEKGWHSDRNEKYYFNESNGGMLTGLRKINGATYYFLPGKGNATKNKTVKVLGENWHFNNAGVGRRI